MKHLVISCLSSIALVILPSCSNTLSEEQKQSLTSVSVAKPAVEANDFRPVDGTDSPNMATGVPVATGGGLIPALVGIAIDASVTAHQASQFEKQYGKTIDQVNAEVPRAIGSELQKRAEKVLKKDAFFGPRLKRSSNNKFDGELLGYGLKRFYREDGETYLGAEIVIRIWLEDANGDWLIDERMTMLSESAYPVSKYAGNKSLMKSVFNEAYQSFEQQFSEILDDKLGR